MLRHVHVDHQPSEVFAGSAAHRDTAARQPAVAGTLQLDLVMRSGLAVREDGANPLEHRFTVLRDHVRELLAIDLVESLPVHRAQRDAEDLLEVERGHAQQPPGVEERDPVRVRVEHRAQLRESAIGLGALLALDVTLPRQLGDEARVADGEGRASRERIREIEVVFGISPAPADRGEQEPAERF